MVCLRPKTNRLDFEDRRVKVKVAAKSDVKKIRNPISPKRLEVSQSHMKSG